MSLRDVFLVKEDIHHQHWTSNKKRYNIGALYDYAKSVTDPEEIPLDSLSYGFKHTNVDEEKWGPEFNKRCRETNMDYPILVVKDRKGRFWIADGNHRYGKAVMQADQMILAYVVDEKDLPEKAIEPEPDADDQRSHKANKSATEEAEDPGR